MKENIDFRYEIGLDLRLGPTVPLLSGMKSRGLNSVQRLRGIAVISVVCYHIWILGYVENLYFLRYGHWGVQLFFIISGFIMIQKLPKYKNLLHFGERRVLRLWPPLFVSLLLSLPFAFVVSKSNTYGEVTLENYVSSALMLNPMLLNGILGTTLNYPFQILWTISVELTFYFAIAILFFSLKRRSIQLSIWVLLISSASILLKLSDLSQFPIRGLALALGTVYFPYFSLGCSIWLIRTRMGSLYILLLITFASLFLSIISTDQPDNEFHRGFVIAGIAVMFSLFIARDSNSQTLPNKFLEYIGDYSYEIYLVHGIVIFPVLSYLSPRIFDNLNLGLWSIILELTYVGLLLTLTVLTGIWLQKLTAISFKQS